MTVLCKLCQSSFQKLQRSHVIPNFILANTYNDKHRMVAVDPSSAKGGKVVPRLVQKKQLGKDVDDQLTCTGCDRNLIGKWENYAKHVLFDPDSRVFKVRRHLRGRTTWREIYECINLDYSKLKLFLLSMTWRLSKSKIEIARAVNVGSRHEEEIRKLLLSNDPGLDTIYPSWITRVSLNEAPLAAASASNFRMTDGLNAVRIFGGGYVFTVLISHHYIPDEILYVRLKVDGTAIVPVMKAIEFADLIDLGTLLPKPGTE